MIVMCHEEDVRRDDFSAIIPDVKTGMTNVAIKKINSTGASPSIRRIHHLPSNMAEVESRAKDILFSDKSIQFDVCKPGNSIRSVSIKKSLIDIS